MFCPCFILSKTENINKKMSCNIAINQQPSLTTSDRPASETKTRDQKRVEAAHRGRENYMKKIKGKVLKR